MAEKKLERCVQLRRGTNLQEFLAQYRPTEILSRDVFWIMVVNPSCRQTFKENADHVTINEVFFRDRWQHIKATREKITADDIKYLAAMTGFVSGKWIINLPKESAVDDIWKRVAIATVQGQLGTAAKVTSREASGERVGHRFLLIVWTSDFTDERDLRRVEAKLRDTGINGPMSYKPDIYKRLGIYFRNEWNISPVYLSSRCATATNVTDATTATIATNATTTTNATNATFTTNTTTPTIITKSTRATDDTYTTTTTTTITTEVENPSHTILVRRFGGGFVRSY